MGDVAIYLPSDVVTLRWRGILKLIMGAVPGYSLFRLPNFSNDILLLTDD